MDKKIIDLITNRIKTKTFENAILIDGAWGSGKHILLIMI